jgi:radical SAM protein with 4Fe4S-binding SPASM domain
VETKSKLEAFCARTGIEDAGYLRPRASLIEIPDEHGHALTCRRPWDTLALHANGDAYICMGWAREPLGNFAKQTFEEIWTGDAMQRVRAEFEEQRPGIDCLHCTICHETADDDFFYRKLAKQLPAGGDRR